MAKGVDRKKLVATLKELEKEYGEGSIYSLDSNKAIQIFLVGQQGLRTSTR